GRQCLQARSHDNFLGSIRTLFKFAKGRGYLPKDHDELDSVEFIDEGKGEIEIFTPAEMSRMLQAASDDFRPCLAIAAFSGIRSAEIERLQWSDVNLNNGEPFIKIVAGKAKTGSRRIVPVIPSLSAWLSPVAVKSGKVWPHGHAYFYEQMREVSKACRVPWKRNALRHSFISYRLAEIRDAARVALEAGNSPKMIFQHYRELVTAEEAKEWFSIRPAGGGE
ncbi:MAG: tyrosine-type recombinase/integrase, partial [Verrucomicrobiales bacterium]|nr:tyrosine-type recombinase/integrase [Verrucomicrobiales bacterium]